MRKTLALLLAAAVVVAGCDDQKKPPQAAVGHPGCSPALGQGHMGACAPRTPLPQTAAPRAIHGLLGVDTSSYQGCAAPPRSVAFWIVKFNESTGYRDRCAGVDIRIAKSRGLAHGGYDFLRPGRTTASQEAATFVSVYRASGARGVAVADVEANDHGLSRAALRAYVCNWAFWVHHGLPNAHLVIYTGAWFSNPQLGGTACLKTLWLSAYANGFTNPAGYSKTTIWQYSDGIYGPVPHINGWDSDVFLGSRSELATLFSAAAPRPKPLRPPSKFDRRVCARLDVLRNHTRHLSRAQRGEVANGVRFMRAHRLSCTRNHVRRVR